MKCPSNSRLPRWRPAAIALFFALAISFAPAAQTTVSTPRKAVVNEYHGVKVTDNYQWLENAQAPAVRDWTARQNARTRGYFNKLPVRDRLADELEDLYEESSANYFALSYRATNNFMLRFKPPLQQPVLISLRSMSRPEDPRLIVNPNKLNTNGTTTIDWFVPSPDGKIVAVSLSEKGSEDGSLYFFDASQTNNARVAEMVPRVHYPTAAGSAAWNADSTGVFYTRYPHKGEKPAADENFYQQVWFHKLGTPVSTDHYEIGAEFPRIAEIDLESSRDGKRILARVANGDGGDFSFWIRLGDGNWKQIARDADGIKLAVFSEDQALYLLSRLGAPRGKILRLPLDAASLTVASATLLVAEGQDVIDTVVASPKGLYVKELAGGPSQIRYFDREGKLLQKISFKNPTAVQQMLVRRGEELTLRTVSFTEPYSWNYFYPGTNRLTRTGLAATAPVEFNDVEVIREMVSSKDGTKVPLNIIRRKGLKLDGNNPTILYGYGGYGISLAPDFKVSRRVWLDAGGVYAIANLRGGGEYGEEWHQAGNMARKQNVFDDFIACAGYLIEKRYTKRERLAIEGGSNGGLLMGAALTQRPELFQAVVSHVGIYDMLRVELEPNGAFNVTEFGTVKDPALFTALHGYSPFHRVRDGTAYPAVLLTTGENDGRVNPYNSKKMAARLQAATTSDRPILLRTSASTGHGIGSSLRERVAEEADVFAFLFDQLGVDIERWYSRSPIERGPWSGALTSESATIKARLRDTGAKAQLVLSKDPEFTRLFARNVSSPALDKNGRIISFELHRLPADTQFYYALEMDGQLQRGKAGQFRTFPAPGPASFTFAFASCGKTGSTNASYEMIRQHHPLFYMNDGDFHYLNIKVNNVKKFRRAYDRVLGSPTQAALYRDVPFAYVWDDHDFGGDNANRKASSHEAARAAYEETVPHYPLAFGDGDVPICQSFAVGRVKFILTDLRSERDPADQKDDAKKSMMGVKQKEWFKKQLLEANGKYPLIFWVSSVPWIGTASTNYYRVSTNTYGYIHHTNITAAMRPSARAGAADETADEKADETKPDGAVTPERTNATNRTAGPGQRGNGRRPGGFGGGRGTRRFPFGEDYWSVFSAERREIADFIKDNNIKGVAILHGDSHMLAADDGSHSDYATGGGAPLPVLCAAPLDQEASLKGGPYSQGVYRVRKGEGAFGLVTVTDDGKRIDVKFSGRNNKDDEKIALQFSVPR
ncbi:MAG: prolyl oligopeptidase [Verrucomicrobiota bacterium]